MIVLQRFANREYRLTNQRILGNEKRWSDKYAEKQAEKYAKAVHSTYVLGQELNQGIAADISNGKLKRHSFGEVDARLGIRALDIIDEFRQMAGVRSKGGWGTLSKPTAFTRNARHRLLEAGAIVDAECGDDAWEITLTLPGSTAEAFSTLAAHTGWIVDRLLKKVRREKCLHWFYVWEFQKRGALHLHLLVAGLGKNTRTLSHCLEYAWWELLWELSTKTSIDLFRKTPQKTWKYDSAKWQSHTAKVYKSVAAYFSKYAGKQSSKTSQGFSRRRAFYPSRWWGCSSHLKNQIQARRAKYSLKLSPSTAKEVEIHLQTWLTNHSRIRRYDYEFDLGVTANGTNLGGGHVCVSYYDDEGFKRMQEQEKMVWDEVLDIARRHDEYADIKDGWTDADMQCPTPYDADMDKRRHHLPNADMQTRKSSPSPHSQPPSLVSKLRNARGTQAEPTLALRALAVQFLAGGGGETEQQSEPPKRATEYIQGEFFDTSCYETIDKFYRSYEI